MQAQTIRALVTGQNSRQGLWLLPLAMSVTVAAVLAVRSEIFTEGTNLLNLVAQATPMIIASLGQLMVVLIGGLDLSVGSVISMATAILVLDQPLWILLLYIFGGAIL